MRVVAVRGVCAWIATLLVLALAACAPLPPKPAPPPAPPPRVFAGSLLWRERAAMPPGARAVVTLTQQGAHGARDLARLSLPVHGSPAAFELEVAPGSVDASAQHLLQARIEDAHGVTLWRLPQAVAVPATGTATPLALLLVWVPPAAPTPRSETPAPAAPSAPPAVSALGLRPSGWNAFIYGEERARRLETVVGGGEVRRSYTGVLRQRLPSGAVIFTANHGWVRLTVSPGGCRIGGEHYAWTAMLEVTGATFRGCARGIP